jgi:superfamily II DNA or RNA helicase
VVKDPRRLFSYTQRNHLYTRADGKCQSCGCELEDDWEADHIIPHSKGGLTTYDNGQALCLPCHRQKTSRDLSMKDLRLITQTVTGIDLLPWQSEALQAFKDKYDRYQPNRDSFLLDKTFVVEAVMGAGKTFLQGALAKTLLDNDVVDNIICVVPSLELKQNVASTLKREFNLSLAYDATDVSAYHKSRSIGQVVTYQALNDPDKIDLLLDNWAANGQRYLLMADEAHHGSSEEGKKWGHALAKLTDYADVALILSGTFWRSDQHMIPSVRYDTVDSEQKIGRVSADYSYSLKRAMEESVVSQVFFHTRSGEVELRDATTGEAETHHIARQCVDEKGNPTVPTIAYEKLLNPEHKWTQDFFIHAHNELQTKRESHMERFGNHKDAPPPPAGLVTCLDISHARSVAKMIRDLTGFTPGVVSSDDTPGSLATIKAFRNSTDPWLVAVKMVTEGVDIPRIKVICMMPTDKTELVFHQLTGRAMRVRRLDDGTPISEESYVLVPEHPLLYQHVKNFVEAAGMPALLDPPTGGGGGGGTPKPKRDVYINFTQEHGHSDWFNGLEGVNKDLPHLIRSTFRNATKEQVDLLVNRGFSIIQENL